MRWLSVLLLVAFVGCGCGPGVSALRCYICEDCDENAQIKEMEVCDGTFTDGNVQGTPPSAGPNPSPSSSPSSGGVSSPAPALPPAVPSAPSDEDEEEDYDSDESASATVGIMPAGNGVATPNQNGGAIGAGAAPAGGAGIGGGAAAGAAASEEEDEEEDEEEEEERRKRSSMARQADLDMPVPACFTVRLQLNETVITKRGCTTARMSNQTANCEGLFDNWTVGGCQICHNDGCNQPISGSSTNIGQWTTIALTIITITSRHLI
ncbi:hypothetical protein KR009_010050 [Drosophila setifemur]|nr:hypothetical protein KR009_010050 [Drosophila setifemur]